ncbi:septum formation protein Maf [Oleispira antarctica]|uniref:7-methyl-GTP pyrophosphatase n=1 Tax=Oleispira antarctica TaxID=188908 RepID=A0A1Y5HRR9_OLEAN|nr:septum formation protein Maf [Oleispira antarctica]
MSLPILLASSSKYRQQLLAKLQLPFDCANPDIDESLLPGENASDYVQRLAIEKAKALKSEFPEHIIIGSDQCAVLEVNGEQRILGKPHTIENAVQQLMDCSGKQVTFLTGLCCFNSISQQKLSMVEPFTVHFRQLTEKQIRRYIECEMPLDCAGSFKSEGLGISLFSALEGRDPNSLIGLPLIALVDFLEQMGVEVI